MLVIKFQGGLGNQLFQYVLYKQLEVQGKKVYADRGGFLKSCKKRDYELDKLKLSVKEAPLWMKKMLIYYERLKKLYADKFKRKRNKSAFGEGAAAFYYDEQIVKGDFSYLNGYFANLQYFDGIKDIVHQEIRLENVDFQKRNLKWLKRIKEVESVAIHVRGGDYIKFKDIYGGICDSSYYQEAIVNIQKKVKDPVFFIFSNDVEYAKKTLPKGKYVYVTGNSEADAVEELMLMSACKHQIIANSTFSWWAAWLNENSNKKIIMPNIWINGVAQVNLSEPDWTIIHVKKGM